MWQVDACIATEQPRPGASGQHDKVADDAAFLGDHAGDAPGLKVDATHSAAGQDNGPVCARCLGDGGCRVRGFRASVGWCVHAGDESGCWHPA